MASATVFDVLRINGGTATLGGTLRIKLLDGFVPDVGTAFTFLRCTAFDGEFDQILLDGYPGAEFELTYGSSSFLLGFKTLPAPVPLPPAWVLLASGLAVTARLRAREHIMIGA